MDYSSKYIISNKKVGDKMNIKVYKSWTIRSYPYGFILAKGISTKDKHGEDSVRYDNETYHNSIESCLKTLSTEELVNSKATTFEELKKDLDKIEKLLVKIAKMCDPEIPKDEPKKVAKTKK